MSTFASAMAEEMEGPEGRDLLAAFRARGVLPTPLAPHGIPRESHSATLRHLWRNTGMRTALLAQGIREEELFGPQPPGETRHVLYGFAVGDDPLSLDEFPSAEAAADYAAHITPDGQGHRGAGGLVTAFAAAGPRRPIHWFCIGRLVVDYIGEDASVLALLNEWSGPQFAGD